LPKDVLPILDETVPGFDVADIFLSHTDERGVIQYGNDVFKRLSGYEWPDLIGTPHKIVRHPDTPKAVFRLFWDTLKAKKTFAGYVKNRSASGQYYWVFAVAVPIPSGYLSVRVKPTSELFADIKSAYAQVRDAEASAGQDPQDGVDQLLNMILGHGFRDYTAYAGFALGREMTERSRALGRPIDETYAQFEQIGELLTSLSAEVQTVVTAFAEISDSPENLNILGSQLKTRRAPMQVVAQNYGMLASEIMGSINEFSRGLEDLLDTAFAGRLDHCAALLYQEAIEKLKTEEPNRGTRGHTEEVQRLTAALDRFVAQAIASCDRIKSEVDRFASLGDRLRRMLSGLAVTRIICLIEAHSVEEDTTSIEEISHKLGSFQEELVKSLDRITLVCSDMVKFVPSVGSKADAA